LRVVDGVEQCVLAAVSTVLGSRIDAPDYGIPDETFRRQSVRPSAQVYVRAVEEAEPRARVLGEARVEEMIEEVVLKVESASV
jgi:phage baseplate assembly protein W